MCVPREGQTGTGMSERGREREREREIQSTSVFCFLKGGGRTKASQVGEGLCKGLV